MFFASTRAQSFRIYTYQAITNISITDFITLYACTLSDLKQVFSKKPIIGREENFALVQC